MLPILTVIICTHNPSQHYLERVLLALERQTLSSENWELVIVDNVSETDLSESLDLSWHANACCIRENRLGVIYARLAGIKTATTDLLVFVDDDNVLAPDYLEKALEIGRRFPSLGAWGGQTLPRFESPPPDWTQDYWSLIGLREFDENKISYQMDWHATPIGAGLCIRKEAALGFIDLVKAAALRTTLGRQGKGLKGCEDLDLAYTAIDCGLGIGVFKELVLHQLIPPWRLKEEYLLELSRETEYSVMMLKYFRGAFTPNLTYFKGVRAQMPWLLHPEYWFCCPRRRRFGRAATAGRLRAVREIFNGHSLSALSGAD